MTNQSSIFSDNNFQHVPIDEIPDLIKSRRDFVEFLSRLVKDWQQNKQQWENQDLSNFLSGLWGFVGSIDGYYKNSKQSTDPESPSWKLFADALLAAKIYE